VKVKYCPKCGKYNRVDFMYCSNKSCREKLGEDTITDIDSSVLSPEFSKELQEGLPKEQSASPSKDRVDKRRVFICPKCGKPNPVFNRTCQDCGGDLSHTTITEVDDTKIEETQTRRVIESTPVQPIYEDYLDTAVSLWDRSHQEFLHKSNLGVVIALSGGLLTCVSAASRLMFFYYLSNLIIVGGIILALYSFVFWHQIQKTRVSEIMVSKPGFDKFYSVYRSQRNKKLISHNLSMAGEFISTVSAIAVVIDLKNKIDKLDK
jgi:hypothetical protein